MSEPKTPKSRETKPTREIDEQTQKHIDRFLQDIDRFLQGREVWNKWANEMLAKKEELEKAGKWSVTKGFDAQDRYRTMSADTSTPEIQAWLDEAYVDFSNLTFQTEQSSDLQGVGEEMVEGINSSVKSITVSGSKIDFSNFIFPEGASFSMAKFQGLASFDGAKFQGWASFSMAKFQGLASFGMAKFQGRASFSEAKFQGWASFSMAKFQGGASFGEAEFQGWASFDEAEFQGWASFDGSKFQGWASFDGSKFQGWASFDGSKFQGGASFDEAEFQREASFGEAEFQGRASFGMAKFQREASFRLVDFERHVVFSKATFHKQADFEAILVKRAFSLADADFTSNIPNFTQANFAESPRLDNIEVIPGPSYKDAAYPMVQPKIPLISPLKSLRYWWNLQFLRFLFRSILRLPKKLIHLIKYVCLKYIFGPLIYTPIKHLITSILHGWGKFTNTRRNPNEEAHYRALKRLAIQAHDHENEMKFFAGEIRARRHVTDFANFLTHDFASSMRYWAGVAYELFSDFGRSFIRPTIWWFACLWLFANLTLSNAGLEDTTKCHNSQLTPKEAAYTIGLKNSLLILGLTKTNIVKQAELCLYGLNKNGANKNGEADREPKTYNPKIKRSYQAKSTKGGVTKTDIPFKVVWQGIIHSGLSLLFIFLLLLAIRNQFKIK